MTDTLDPIDLDKTAEAMDAPDRGRYSPAEWQARLDLAVLYRALHLYGMSDVANGAIAARVPDQPDHYLIHPYGMYWEEATASSFVTVSPDGTPVHDDKRWVNDGAVNLFLRQILNPKRNQDGPASVETFAIGIKLDVIDLSTVAINCFCRDR